MTGAAEGLRLPGGGGQPAAASDQDDPEAMLRRRFASAEAGAFERVVAQYQDRVGRLASRLLGWRGDVDDVVQDVFLAAFRNVSRLRERVGGTGDDLWPWLAAITVNACRTRRRREWVRRAFLRQRRASADAIAPAADAEPEAREHFGRVRDALGQLRAADRELLVLHHLEEMPASDLAVVFGISANTVQVRLHRARRRLKGEMGELFPEE